MPKSYGDLWPQIVSFENLLRGFNEARKGKRYQLEVLRFSDRLEENIFIIQDNLITGRWRPSPFREFIKVDTLKRRLIQAPAFCDRVVHHAFIGITQPFMERKWIYDSYACRRGKGVHRCVSRTKDFLYRAWRMWGRVYVLQVDISKYFQLGPTKHYLKDILAEIKWFVETKLKLYLNPKTRIYPASQGVDFAGYRTWKTHILPRKRNVKAAKKRFKSISRRYAKGEIGLEYAKSRVVSFIGYMQHCNGYCSTVSALKYLVLRRN